MGKIRNINYINQIGIKKVLCHTNMGNTIYILNNGQKYKEFGVDSMYVLAIGKLNVDGAFSYVDTLELPNEITRGGSRLFNSILTFYSDNNIYYCVIKE